MTVRVLSDQSVKIGPSVRVLYRLAVFRTLVHGFMVVRESVTVLLTTQYRIRDD